ncbi:MAG: Zn-dependent exopeptidase M28 [Kiritimatiellae bacterium]|nr:Zn-dependent exopeptidase M28 [Kiritimatiellia bacterium]
MMSFNRHFFIPLMLLALFAGCRDETSTVNNPASLAPSTLAADFGTNALMRVQRLCALGPRDALTPGAETAAKWIADELAASDLSPSIDSFDDPAPNGASRLFRNVTATASGTGAGHVLLLSHYDTKTGISNDFVGANDGASSTGLLLELAAHYARHPASPSVTVAFLDGEECRHTYNETDGLHGSRHLARKMQQAGERIDAVILLDMVGDRDLCLTLPRNGTARLKTALLDASAAKGLRAKVKLLPYDILDDHQPFLDAGFPAIDLIDFEYGSAPGLRDYWHTPADTPDKLSAQSLHDVGAIVHELIEQIASKVR